MNLSGVFAILDSVTTIPILAPLAYSLASASHRALDYLPQRELFTHAFVDAASTTKVQQAQLALRTDFSAGANALISPDLKTHSAISRRRFYRFNVEQKSEFVKHWSAQLIRPEEETKHAGDPT